MVETTVSGVDDEGKPVLDQDGNVATKVVYGSRKDKPRQRPIVICIGFTQFNSMTGHPSKHAKLIHRFVQVARPLEHIVADCNEFCTSAKCPKEGCNEFLESLPNRSKYCRNWMHFDRDGVDAGKHSMDLPVTATASTSPPPPKFIPTPQEPSPNAATPPPPPTSPAGESSSISDKSKATRHKGPLADEALIQRVQTRSQRSQRPQPTSNRD